MVTASSIAAGSGSQSLRAARSPLAYAALEGLRSYRTVDMSRPRALFKYPLALLRLSGSGTLVR